MKVLILLVSLFILASCGNKKSQVEQAKKNAAEEALQNKDFFETPGYVKAITENQELKKTLEKCVYADNVKKSCQIKELPLLRESFSQDEAREVRIQKIMERVLVSHPFLAKNFEEVLKVSPITSLRLFGAVNAIIISDNVNPSFYWMGSGAIYLSANYFWMNQSEKKQLFQKEDYRNGFGAELQFEVYRGRRLRIKDRNTTLSAIREQQEASATDLSYYAGRVLIHELSHANDFYPIDMSDFIKANENKSYEEVGDKIIEEEKTISARMPKKVKEEIIKQIGKVLYHGAKPADYITSLSAGAFWYLFKNEQITDAYAISNDYEDLAMTFESAMMNYYFECEYFSVVYGISKNKTGNNDQDFPIEGGFYNKIHSDGIADKKKFVISHVFNNSVIENKIEDHFTEMKKENYYQHEEIKAGTLWENIF